MYRAFAVKFNGGDKKYDNLFIIGTQLIKVENTAHQEHYI